MAREYARVKLAIWADDDFRDLSMTAQALYFKLITSPTINLAGVADYRPRRLAALTKGATPEAIEQAANELVQRLYIVIDEDTEEVLVRSFIRHDGLVKTPNIAVAMAKDYAGVASRTLRGVIVHELHRLKQDEPNLKGWKAVEDVMTNGSIDPVDLLENNPSGNPSVMALDNPSGNPYPNPSGNGYHIPHPSSINHNPQPTSPENPSETRFDEFWDAFPKERKANKKGCQQKFAKALTQGVPADRIIQAARSYANDPNRDPAFTVSPHRWLNEERWDSPPLPPRQQSPVNRAQQGLDLARRYAEAEQHHERPQIEAQ